MSGAQGGDPMDRITLPDRRSLPVPEFVREHLRTYRIPALGPVCKRGERVADIRILVRGELTIINHFADGNVYAFTTEKSFTIIGDLEFFSGKLAYATSVNAKTDVVMASLDFACFQRWLDADPGFQMEIVRALAVKCYKMADIQGGIKYKNALQRVTETLRSRIPGNAWQDGWAQVHCTHLELSQMTGMSERTVNRVLQKLRRDGIVQTEYGKLLIHQAALEALERQFEE